MTTRLPLFPLNSVLCPGVALPLHIFEERYRLMISRCVEREEPFGVVLLRDGREIGALSGRIARVGTTAVIREAGRYPDGRLDIVTLGERRFRVEELDSRSEPYLVGRVRLLDEPLGEEAAAAELAARVARHFLEYLELLQPAADDALAGAETGPDVEIEIEFEIEGEEEPASLFAPSAGSADLIDQEGDATQRRERLMSAARRLTSTDDPTALSYVIAALVQVEISARQELLEAPDTVTRLGKLDLLLAREMRMLRHALRPLLVDPGLVEARRN